MPGKVRNKFSIGNTSIWRSLWVFIAWVSCVMQTPSFFESELWGIFLDEFQVPDIEIVSPDEKGSH